MTYRWVALLPLLWEHNWSFYECIYISSKKYFCWIVYFLLYHILITVIIRVLFPCCILSANFCQRLSKLPEYFAIYVITLGIFIPKRNLIVVFCFPNVDFCTIQMSIFYSNPYVLLGFSVWTKENVKIRFSEEGNSNSHPPLQQILQVYCWTLYSFVHKEITCSLGLLF